LLAIDDVEEEVIFEVLELWGGDRDTQQVDCDGWGCVNRRERRWCDCRWDKVDEDGMMLVVEEVWW
jgi:hypothetical protein